MKFELIEKVPIVDIDGKRCFLDTGCPYAFNTIVQCGATESAAKRAL